MAIKRMKKKFHTWEECVQLREVKVSSSVLHKLKLILLLVFEEIKTS